jgi:hypothetical protein
LQVKKTQAGFDPTRSMSDAFLNQKALSNRYSHYMLFPSEGAFLQGDERALLFLLKNLLPAIKILF